MNNPSQAPFAEAVSCAVPWRCAATRVGYEHHTKNALLRIGAEVFLPETWKPTKETKYRHSFYKATPMFPGYLFARLDLAARSRAVLGVNTNPRWVKFGNEIVPVPDDLVSDLFARRNERGYIPLDDATPCPTAEERVYPKLRKDERVRVLTGPFAGQVGLFSRDANERVIVLMNILTATFERSQVEAVTD
jgi:transcriptional antiterminator RfaH